MTLSESLHSHSSAKEGQQYGILMPYMLLYSGTIENQHSDCAIVTKTGPARTSVWCSHECRLYGAVL